MAATAVNKEAAMTTAVNEGRGGDSTRLRRA